MTRIAARIVARAPLRYTEGADAALDRPAHVRAGSGLCVVETPRGRRLLVAQDDAAFFALVDVRPPPRVSSIALPAPDGVRLFDERRGNKQDKLDLECVAVFAGSGDGDGDGPLVIALGSGSSPKRERAVLARVDREPAEVRVVDAHALHAHLRAHPLMQGAELNLEGMGRLRRDEGDTRGDTAGDTVRLFQRGNGAGGVDATFDVDARALLAFLAAPDATRGPPPPIVDARRWDLGRVQGVRLTFTDACAVRGPDGGAHVAVTVAAEDSPNAVDDGVVVGCALGLLGEPLAPIVDEAGAPFVGKPEGLAFDPDDPTRAWIVLDKDDPDVPCELLTLAVAWTA